MNCVFVISLILVAFGCNLSKGAKILEVQTKTNYEDQDAGAELETLLDYQIFIPFEAMAGRLAVTICDSNLNCCDAGELDSDRNDYNWGHVDVFWGSYIGECLEYEVADGPALMMIAHVGIDAWKGDWIRCKINI